MAAAWWVSEVSNSSVTRLALAHVVVLGRPGATEGGRGLRPRKTGAGRERVEVLHPGEGLVAVVAADGGVDAVLGGHQHQGGQLHRRRGRCHLAELVQGAGGVTREQCPDALGPPGQVLDRLGQDAHGRVCGHQGLQGGEAFVVVGATLECGEQCQPRPRGGRRRGLPDAETERDGLLRGVPQRSPLAAHVLAEREALEGVQDGHAVPVLPGGGQHQGVEAAVRVVVAQVQGSVREVPEQVEVGERVGRPEGGRLRVRAARRMRTRGLRRCRAGC